jgi:hypothetical protein
MLSSSSLSSIGKNLFDCDYGGDYGTEKTSQIVDSCRLPSDCRRRQFALLTSIAIGRQKICCESFGCGHPSGRGENWIVPLTRTRRIVICAELP